MINIVKINKLILVLICCLLVSSSCQSNINKPVIQGSEGKLQNHPIKIITHESGMYEISLNELRNYGWSGNSSNKEELSLTNRGKLIPFWIEESNNEAFLRFFASEVDSLYSDQNVFILDNRKIDPESNSPESIKTNLLPSGISTVGTNTFLASIDLGEQSSYQPQVDEGDHWLWFSIVAPSEKTIEFELSQLSTGPALLYLYLWSNTSGEKDPDHRMIVLVNGKQISEEGWDAKGRHTIQIEIPEGILKEGKNEIVLQLPGNPDVLAEITWIDWLRIYFPRKLVTENNHINIIGENKQYEFNQLSGKIDIYDVTSPGMEELLYANQETPFKVDLTEGKNILVIGSGGYHKPEKISLLISEPDLKDDNLAGDYIIIGPEEFLESLKPLANFRENQGMKPLLIPLEAVYDQFNNGFPEPKAIRAFLQWGYQRWELKPKYVLLVGDATYDPKSYFSPTKANRLPTYLIKTVYGGETASDLGYGELESIDWPSDNTDDLHLNIAIGRIPARSINEIESVVSKIITFERDLTSEEANPSILAVADNQEPFFQQDAQKFLDKVSPAGKIVLLSPVAYEGGDKKQVVKNWNEGYQWVVYFGHGSITQWGKDNLFSVNDVKDLDTNHSPPIVINFTCLTGLFTHPTEQSLAESLLFVKDSGAIAVLSPTSLTLPTDQSYLSDALAEGINTRSSQRLGDIILNALNSVPTNTEGRKDVISTFLLLGDPALKIP